MTRGSTSASGKGSCMPGRIGEGRPKVTQPGVQGHRGLGQLGRGEDEERREWIMEMIVRFHSSYQAAAIRSA
jgi:hypothetical protein